VEIGPQEFGHKVNVFEGRNEHVGKRDNLYKIRNDSGKIKIIGQHACHDPWSLASRR
jgi:hypothetical protein